MALTPGTILGGRYVIDGVLGQGGFATVYAARHTQLASEHAIKVLHVGADDVARARLRGEGRILSRMNHPNIVRVTDVVELPFGVGLVMELIRGESLGARLRRGRAPLHEARALGEGLLRGVAAAHALGLVHRDLKPENVLIDLNGVPKVIDFGIAREDSVAGHTLAGVGMGTPGYMAPEAYHDAASVGPPADVFSLGVILYELLSGQRPFEEGGPWMRQLQRASQATWTPLSALSPELPQTLIHTVHAALSPHAAHRPPDAGSLLSCWLGEVAPSAPESAATITFELDEPSAASTSPELAPRHHLPAERDAFIGRERDLRALTARFAAGARAVTVLGIGGLGKTRLAVHFGHLQLRARPGGVWFCDLAEARDLDGVVRAVAAALGVPLGREPVVQLGHAIAGRGPCLVILDNFEQVTALAPETVGRWLDLAPEAHLLITSRARLGLPGETVMVLSPLDEDAAVALFTARAAAAGGALAVEDLAHVRALVRLLDDLPLAIELAAARARMMRPATMVDRLKDRFRLLSAPGGRPDRHATLRGMLDWSWELLSEEERRGLSQLSVFVGGFNLEAAEAVLEVGDAWPADLLQSLVDKSLVRSEIGGDASEPRFDLLVSVTEYAAARLDVLGDRVAVEARHGAHYASFGVPDALEALHREGGRRLHRALQPDVDNLIAALRRAVTRGDGDVAARTLGVIWEIVRLRGPFGVGSALAALVLSMAELADLPRAEALRVHATALRVMGRLDESWASAEAARALYSRLGDGRGECGIVVLLGGLLLARGSTVEAEALLTDALRWAHALGAWRFEAMALSQLGALYLKQGRFQEARAILERELVVLHAHGDRHAEGICLGNLAIQTAWSGDHARALELMTQTLALARESDDLRSEAFALTNLAALRQELGQRAEALDSLTTALSIARALGERRLEGGVLGALTSALLLEGRLDEAQARGAEGERLLRTIGDRIELAKLLSVRSRLHHARRDPEAAATDLAEAEALAAAARVTPESELARSIATTRALLG